MKIGYLLGNPLESKIDGTQGMSSQEKYTTQILQPKWRHNT